MKNLCFCLGLIILLIGCKKDPLDEFWKELSAEKKLLAYELFKTDTSDFVDISTSNDFEIKYLRVGEEQESVREFLKDLNKRYISSVAFNTTPHDIPKDINELIVKNHRAQLGILTDNFHGTLYDWTMLNQRFVDYKAAYYNHPNNVGRNPNNDTWESYFKLVRYNIKRKCDGTVGKFLMRTFGKTCNEIRSDYNNKTAVAVQFVLNDTLMIEKFGNYEPIQNLGNICPPACKDYINYIENN